MVQRARLRRGQQALLRATNGAAFPPTAEPGARALGGQRYNVPTYGRAGSPCSGWPTVQRFHLWQGREPVPWEANGAVFPPATRPAGAAESDERYSVPTYGRAGSRCPGRPTVQRSHLSEGSGAGARRGQRCSVPTSGRAGNWCSRRPTVQGSRGPGEGGGGDKAYQQCRISTDPGEDSRSRHN